MTGEFKASTIKKIYCWIFSLAALFVILLAFCIYISYKVFTCSPVVSLDSDGNYLTMLIAVAGFLAAFSAISIYSIFNASVDREKERIDELENDCAKKINELNKKLNKKINNEIEISRQSDLNLKNHKALFDLTSPYSPERKRREAIQHFILVAPETKDIRTFIRNYFQSLGDTERNKPYYLGLENLINGWGTLYPEEVTAGIE